jgi:DeoR/GlpR family transcriptional regulator of sugar metabolism
VARVWIGKLEAVHVPDDRVVGDVFARERQDRIARIVEEHGRARVGDLAVRFGVSAVTIRKDLVTLEATGRIVRTHGGAIVPDRNHPELAFDIRERLQQDEKAAIGAMAAELIRDGESIVMDASTTALAVARRLRSERRWSQLTVITNGLRLASELAGSPGVTVLMLGGRVRWEALSVVGQLGDGLFSRINVQKAIVGAAGFTLETGLSDATDEEAQIKRLMVAAASEVIAIVDHTKWQRSAFATFCQTPQITSVLTDSEAPAAMVEALRGQGIGVQLVDVARPGAADARPTASNIEIDR